MCENISCCEYVEPMVALCAIFMLETKSSSQRTFRFKRPLRRISFLEKSFLEDLSPLKRSKVLPGGLLKWPPSSQKGFDLPRRFLEDQGLHSNLGHPGPRALARAIRLSGGSDEAVSAALSYKCSTCARLREPKPVNPARLNDRWRDFGDLVCVDLSLIHI